MVFPISRYHIFSTDSAGKCQDFQRAPKSVSTPGSAGCQTPKLPIPFSAEGSEPSLPCGATTNLPSSLCCRDRKALADGHHPRRPPALGCVPTPARAHPLRCGRCVSAAGGFSFSLRHLFLQSSRMPGLVAGWHKACIVHARRPERRSNCLPQLRATICWQPGLCHYITGDSPTCKQISRTCLSSLILEKQ